MKNLKFNATIDSNKDGEKAVIIHGEVNVLELIDELKSLLFKK